MPYMKRNMTVGKVCCHSESGKFSDTYYVSEGGNSVIERNNPMATATW